MARIFFRFGKFLFFSRKRENIRGGIMPFVTLLFALASILFSLEIALILLGTTDIFLPLSSAAHGLLKLLSF